MDQNNQLSKKTALIAGASGLTGSRLLRLCLDSGQYEEVRAIVRSPLGIKHPRLAETVILDFDDLEDYAHLFDVEDLYCCLGTTIKKAKSKEAMLKVDSEYPLMLAKLGQESRVRHFSLISAMGANPHSAVWYSKMKGELEKQISGFRFPSTAVIRPSLLLGERKEHRKGESAAAKLSSIFSSLMKGPLLKYKPIEAQDVALAMFRIAGEEKYGITYYENDELHRLSEK